MKRCYVNGPADILGRAVRNDAGCLIWQRGKFTQGYGAVYFQKRTAYAHRVLYQMLTGQTLERSQHVLHNCDVPACVNPDHLRLGTHQDNMTDKKVRGRARGRFSPK